jgi:PPM family protein phosphatase
MLVVLMTTSQPVYQLVSCSRGPREEQQDASGFFEVSEACLLVVCDGAGGHRGGALASQAAVEEAGRIFHDKKGIFSDPEAALKEICEAAHKRIQGLGESAKLAPRSTITAVYIAGCKAHWVHVGDSRIYYLKHGKIVQRTKDHTMVQILFEQGEVREEEMGTHPDQGRLLRALGADDELKVSTGSADLADGDGFLLCTDGFWERIKPREIEKLFSSVPPSKKALDALVEKAVQRNGPKGDNVTVGVMGLKPQHEETPRAPHRVRQAVLLVVVFIAILVLLYIRFRDGLWTFQ